MHLPPSMLVNSEDKNFVLYGLLKILYQYIDDKKHGKETRIKWWLVLGK